MKYTTEAQRKEARRRNNRNYYARNRDKVNRLHTESRNRNPVAKLWIDARRRAKKLGLPCEDKAPDSLQIPEFCPVLGLKLIVGDNKRSDYSPSIDRILPELGYVSGNVRIVSYRANRIKNDATAEEAMLIAADLQDYDALAGMLGISE